MLKSVKNSLKKEKNFPDVNGKEFKLYVHINANMVQKDVGEFVQEEIVMEKELQFVKENVSEEENVSVNVSTEKLEVVSLIEYQENGFTLAKKFGEQNLIKLVLKNAHNTQQNVQMFVQMSKLIKDIENVKNIL